MRLLPSSCAGALSLLCSLAIAAPTELKARDLSSFIASERAIALQGALNNIGPDGSAVPGAGAGFVVASPSKANPDCQYPSTNIFLTTSQESQLRVLTIIRLLHMESGLSLDIENDH